MTVIVSTCVKMWVQNAEGGLNILCMFVFLLLSKTNFVAKCVCVCVCVTHLSAEI